MDQAPVGVTEDPAGRREAGWRAGHRCFRSSSPANLCVGLPPAAAAPPGAGLLRLRPARVRPAAAFRPVRRAVPPRGVRLGAGLLPCAGLLGRRVAFGLQRGAGFGGFQRCLLRPALLRSQLARSSAAAFSAAGGRRVLVDFTQRAPFARGCALLCEPDLLTHLLQFLRELCAQFQQLTFERSDLLLCGLVAGTAGGMGLLFRFQLAPARGLGQPACSSAARTVAVSSSAATRAALARSRSASASAACRRVSARKAANSAAAASLADCQMVCTASAAICLSASGSSG